MRRSLAALYLFFFCISLPSCAIDLNKIVRYADAEEAGLMLSNEDGYTEYWGRFDIESKSMQVGAEKPDLLQFLSTQGLNWTEEEKEVMRRHFAVINGMIERQQVDFRLPEEVVFIKSTMESEGDAEGYTRENYVVLNERNILSEDTSFLTKLIIHELFHIYSRHNPERRKELYEIIGFSVENDMELPPVIKDRRISNPDAPSNDCFIQLTAGGDTVTAAILIYSAKDYAGGSFFSYLNLGFLEVMGEPYSRTPVIRDGQPVIHAVNGVNGFFEKIGRNTQYIIHPEEIMAENFVYLLEGNQDLPNPEIPEAMREIMK